MAEVIDTSNLPSAAPAEQTVSDESEKRIEKAKEFLSQPNVQSSPFGRRVTFLKSKGLTLQEIHTAFAAVGQPKEMKEIEEAATKVVAPPAVQQTALVKPTTQEVYQPRALGVKPPQQQVASQELTWKDYFIGTTVALGSAFGLKCLADQFLDIDVRWRDPKRKTRKEIRELPPLPNEAIRKIGEMESKMEKVEAGSKTSTETVTEMKTYVDSKVRPEISSLAAKLEGRARMIDRLGDRLNRMENDKLKPLEEANKELKATISELKNKIDPEASKEEETKNDETEEKEPETTVADSLVADAPNTTTKPKEAEVEAAPAPAPAPVATDAAKTTK